MITLQLLVSCHHRKLPCLVSGNASSRANAITLPLFRSSAQRLTLTQDTIRQVHSHFGYVYPSFGTPAPPSRSSPTRTEQASNVPSFRPSPPIRAVNSVDTVARSLHHGTSGQGRTPSTSVSPLAACWMKTRLFSGSWASYPAGRAVMKIRVVTLDPPGQRRA